MFLMLSQLSTQPVHKTNNITFHLKTSSENMLPKPSFIIIIIIILMVNLVVICLNN